MEASLDEEEEEEEETGSIDSGNQPLKPKDGCYKIHGTLKDSKSAVPDFVEEVTRVSYVDYYNIKISFLI